MWIWHYNKWRRVYFPTTLSSQVPKVQKNKTTITIIILFFQINELCELMCEYEHLLEHKSFDLDFLCGNDIMTIGGGYIFHKNQNCHSLF